MSKRAFLLVLAPPLLGAGLALLLIDGCMGSSKPKFGEEEAQRSGLWEASGGLVLAVGGEALTSDEIIRSLIERNGAVLPLIEHLRPIAQETDDFEQFKEQARPEVEQALTNELLSILLYQRAKRNAGDVDEALERAAEAEVRKIVVNEFGGDEIKAKKALKEIGIDWQKFKENQKRKILSAYFISSQLPKARPIAYSELLDCYNEMKDEFFVIPATVTLRLIDIKLAELEVANANQNRLKEARELANELLGRLQAGEDFGELAKQYSHGYRAPLGGLWETRQPQSLAEPYDVLANPAERIEPGQIAGSIEAGEHIFIMKLEERQAKSYRPLKEVQREVEQKTIFDREQQAREEIMAELMQQTDISSKSEFIDFCLKRIYEMRNQSTNQD